MTSSTPASPRATRRPQELRPAGGVLGGDDVEAHDLALALVVDGGGDDGRDVDHPTGFSDLLGQGVDPHVAIGAAVERAVPERGHLGVELSRHAGHLRAADALDAHGFDQVVDPAGGHPLDVGLADHRHQGLFGPTPGREQPLGEVAALAELRDGQVDRAHPGVPGPGPVAVSGVGPLLAALVVGGAAGCIEAWADISVSAKALSIRPGQVVVAVVALEILAKPGASVDSRRDSHRDPPQVVCVRTAS